MTKKTRNGWGLLQRGIVIEAFVGKKKPHHEVFFDGHYHSKIIPIKIIYKT